MDVDAASAEISGETPLAPVILPVSDMFGTRILGVEDPNGYVPARTPVASPHQPNHRFSRYKVYFVEEAGFRNPKLVVES